MNSILLVKIAQSNYIYSRERLQEKKAKHTCTRLQASELLVS
jgi:hypothetical protein